MFIQWKKETTENDNINFSKLKLLKLLFFASAVNVNKNNLGLLDIFDNFYAMPLGHIEKCVFDNIEQSKILKFSIKGIEIIKDVPDGYFDSIKSIIPRLENSVKSLKEKNKELINLSDMDLVDINHLWFSWKSIYHLARYSKKYSMKIPVDFITNDNKYFHPYPNRNKND